LHGIHTCCNHHHQRLSCIIIHDLVEYVKTVAMLPLAQCDLEQTHLCRIDCNSP
jgi:hypothetical protein